MPILELRDIRKSFGATRALVGVDFAVERGTVHALIGENGAGKSTLMNILSGMFPQDAGEMRIAGAVYAPASPRDARSRGIAHVHQELSICAHLSVAENVLLGNEMSKAGVIERAAAHDRVAALLAGFGCEYINPESRAGSLSVAEQQAVEICRALASNARIILMDEPTSSLSQANIERLFNLITRLKQNGVAIIYISHFLEEVRRIADTFTVLRDGKSIRSGALSVVTEPELVAAMVGREVDEMFVKHERRPTEGGDDIVLRARDVSSAPRLRNASFDLRRGEVLGIAGLVGSGRTELVRALFGLDRMDGTVEIIASKSASRKAVKSGHPADRIRQGLGYLSEDRKGEGVCLELSIADNVTITRMRAVSASGWLNLRRQDAAGSEIISKLAVRASGPRTKVARLSGGNQQKVAVGRLLHQDPEVFLLDEPTRGIDIGSKAEIYKVIRRLAGEGKAVLMVSSYLPELLGVCDRIAVMCRGRLSVAKPVAEWTAESIMRVAIGGNEQQEARPE